MDASRNRPVTRTAAGAVGGNGATHGRNTSPGRRYFGFVLALALGTVGGLAFYHFALPLPWMLGSMTAAMIASLLRIPIVGIQRARLPMTAIIGVLLGSSVTYEIVRQMPTWIPSLTALFGFLVLSALVNGLYYRFVGRLDPVTAFFAGMPSGLIAMVALGGEKGGDEKTIALVHASRIFLVVMLLPYFVQFISGASLGGARSSGFWLSNTPVLNLAWIVVVAIVGVWVGGRLRLPARHLTGPLLVSALVHATDLTDFHMPRELVIVAQVFLGTLIGCRFIEFTRKRVLAILVLTTGSSAILLGLTAGAGLAMSALFGTDPKAVILAYSPGGMTEMSLVALSLNIDVAFVAVHHIARFMLVMSCANLGYSMFNKVAGRSGGDPDAGNRPARPDIGADHDRSGKG